MTANDERFEVARDVHVRRFHDELVLLDLARGEYFSLDEVGAAAWDALAAGQTLRETVAVVAAHYDADVVRIEADLERLVAELTRRNLLVPKAPEGLK
jgi:hypothetical protein